MSDCLFGQCVVLHSAAIYFPGFSCARVRFAPQIISKLMRLNLKVNSFDPSGLCISRVVGWGCEANCLLDHLNGSFSFSKLLGCVTHPK